MFVQLSEIFLHLCGLFLWPSERTSPWFTDSFFCPLCTCTSRKISFKTRTAAASSSDFILFFFGAKIGMQLNRFCFVGLFPAAQHTRIKSALIRESGDIFIRTPRRNYAIAIGDNPALSKLFCSLRCRGHQNDWKRDIEWVSDFRRLNSFFGRNDLISFYHSESCRCSRALAVVMTSCLPSTHAHFLLSLSSSHFPAICLILKSPTCLTKIEKETLRLPICERWHLIKAPNRLRLAWACKNLRLRMKIYDRPKIASAPS